jgi:hypothetical protein
MSALDDRRQAAREAYHDELKSGTGGYYRHTAAAEAAIETATRVRITPEIVAGCTKGACSHRLA